MLIGLLFHAKSLMVPLLWIKLQDYDPYEENPGTAPFSEPETQIMRKLAISFDPHIWVNVHSGMEVTNSVPSSVYFVFYLCTYMLHIAYCFQALFMPYDHKNTTPDGIASQRMKSLLAKLNHLHCHERCMIGSGGGSVG